MLLYFQITVLCPTLQICSWFWAIRTKMWSSLDLMFPFAPSGSAEIWRELWNTGNCSVHCNKPCKVDVYVCNTSTFLSNALSHYSTSSEDLQDELNVLVSQIKLQSFLDTWLLRRRKKRCFLSRGHVEMVMLLCGPLLHSLGHNQWI